MGHRGAQSPAQFSQNIITVMNVFSPQTLVKLNPKLQPMVDMIKANRVKWEELDKKRQHDHGASVPASPCGAAEGPETGVCALTKAGSAPCCSNTPPTHVS